MPDNLKPLKKLTKKLKLTRLSSVATELLRDEAISGKLILAATILALLVANSFLGKYYQELLHIPLSFGLGELSLSKDLGHWVSEGLMTIFFLVVGLELSRELRGGELRRFKTAALPFVAAIGGMLVPALLFILFNPPASATFAGWAIPTATDIAFAVAIIATIGKRIPSSIRLFLLTLAIVDDIVAVIIIAIFYTASVGLLALAAAGLLVGVILILQKIKRLSLTVFLILALCIWLAIDASGVHASIAGAIIGLIAPLVSFHSYKRSIAARLEKYSIPLSTFIAVPLFAFVSTGIVFSGISLQSDTSVMLALGIIAGLVIGKVVGISLATFLMVKFKLADLPAGANWQHIIGVGLLAGIGFTVSLFVTELAFEDEIIIRIAKISIFVASVISGSMGYLLLRLTKVSPNPVDLR